MLNYYPEPQVVPQMKRPVITQSRKVSYIIIIIKELGLTLNSSKSEIITRDLSTCAPVLSSLPGARVLDPACATLLGSPIGDPDSVTSAVVDKTTSLKRVCERLNALSAHDALLLLRHSFAITKALYLLRTAPCFDSPALIGYDSVLRSALSSITNTHLGVDSQAWFQATLPIKLGGLGIRRATDLAPSAYLASIHASSDLVKAILPSSYVCLFPLLDDALGSWSAGHGSSPPVELTHKQKIWDHPRVIAASNSLLQNASSDVDKARLLAATSKESGVWLQALPVSSLGLRLDDDSLRVAVGLRLGTPLCVPHQCRHCGAEVDTTGHHALSCKWSAGRHHRHASLNDLSTEPYRWLMFLLAWNLWVCYGVMANALMVHL